MKVYRFGCRLIEGAREVHEQLRAAHDYRNDLVAIERGRRAALREIDDTPEVRAAIEVVLRATAKERNAAIAELRDARKAARAARPDDLERISDLDAQIRRDARAITPAYWGQYLDVEAGHQQMRAMALYQDDAVTPRDPVFRAWRGVVEGHVGIQIQGGLPTSEVVGGGDTRVRLALSKETLRRGRVKLGVLWLRVGSEGRDPVWAKFGVRLHRAIPDAARWKWVRASLRPEGPHGHWSIEVTVDDPAPPARALDRSLTGAIAVEWEWHRMDDGSIRVASWADTLGERGVVVIPPRVVTGIRKPDGIRSTRDMLLDDAREKIAGSIRGSREPRPAWLDDAAERIVERTDKGWRYPIPWVRALVLRWRREQYDGCRPAYEMLDAWWERDTHLWEYEAGARREALCERREHYRLQARRWAGKYRTAILSDQDLSREAKWGPESEDRTTAGCYELRDACRNAFGGDAADARWRMPKDEADDRDWCERSIGAWIEGGARKEEMIREKKIRGGNAWASRKAKKADASADLAGAREPSATDAE